MSSTLPSVVPSDHEYCTVTRAGHVPPDISTRAEAWEIWDSSTHPCELGPGKFHFNYADNHQERVLIIEGEATLTPTGADGADGAEGVITISTGDYVVFHRGFECNWHVTSPMRKHYCYFDEEGNETQANNLTCDKCGADCWEESYLCNDEDICTGCWTKKAYPDFEYQREGEAFVKPKASRKKARK
ncbi:hypothetical protein B484DRAFT_444426 [Ochromonadaceae sp. CCMP2298]|nr:hypothetical protein B484DRAFT_444426 [Ochromonadaceae sp. CCMP2298]|eukprot:CAMPEP_0173234622 /NCGR_PEP_ID=MMETSP1142-20121109/10332_1 /TAXON_ID=483371 /ORGANISM="non described non described, Strain CCMP2298" /LENGTH=186 /DNA_ID=CAMNT_0014164691 /DNA_START=24 /DNA_END=584 /DNA_ORIENTATION=+